MEDFHCYAEQFLHMFLFVVCGVFPIATDYRFTWKLFYDYFVNILQCCVLDGTFTVIFLWFEAYSPFMDAARICNNCKMYYSQSC